MRADHASRFGALLSGKLVGPGTTREPAAPRLGLDRRRKISITFAKAKVHVRHAAIKLIRQENRYQSLVHFLDEAPENLIVQLERTLGL